MPPSISPAAILSETHSWVAIARPKPRVCARFAIFSLIVRESLRRNPRGKAISTHSLAISLSRSFETVRRHVIALTEAGLCVRGQ